MSNKQSKQILLIGVGGTGSRAIDILTAKMKKLGNQTGNMISAIVFDTDERDVAKIQNAVALPLVDTRYLETIVNSLNRETVEDWFPCYDEAEAKKRKMHPITKYSAQDLKSGASQWRKKSFLAFVNLLHNDARRARFENALRSLASHGGVNGDYEVFIVASIAGGTGSGSFIPLSMYAKKFLTETCGVKNVGVTAMLATPDIYLDCLHNEDEKTKVQANAYAILRELNAMNLVAFGHNNPDTQSNKRLAPIHFHLGHEKDTKLKVLFDSDKKEYWKPEHAPFKKVYLFDRINGLNSVAAHDSVMASALYSLICTNVGIAFNGRDNNNLPKIASNPNAIFASMSATEIEYPIDSIIDYVSHKKALQAVEGDWLLIYDQVERKIQQARAAAKKKGQRFTFGLDDYVDYVDSTVKNVISTKLAGPELTLIINNGLYNFHQIKESDGTVKQWQEDRLELYIRSVEDTLRGYLDCEAADLLKGATDTESKTFQKDIESAGVFASRAKKEAKRRDLMTRVKNNFRNLNAYYEHAVEKIIDIQMDTIDAILPTENKISPMANKELSLVYNLLTRDGKFIHPVAAYIMLAKLYKLLKSKLEGFVRWEDIDKGDLNNLTFPIETLSSSASGDDDNTSAYVFATMAVNQNKQKDYIAESKNDPVADSQRHRTDLSASYKNLADAAEEQIKGVIFTAVAATVQKLLERYRAFFRDFSDGKDALASKTAELRTADENTDEKILVCASGADKDRAYEAFDANTEEDEEAIDELYHVCGNSVFTLNYNAVLDPKAPTALDSLFKAIVDAYRSQLMEGDYYLTQSTKSVFEVLIDYYTEVEGKSMQDAAQEVGILLTYALGKAEPSIFAEGEKIQSNSVVMLHNANGAYLKKNENALGLKHFDDGEHSIMEFVKKVGITAEIEVADNTPTGTLYITRKIDTIRPTDVPKLNEAGKYYENYCTALAKMAEEDNDMWNPHLGMTLHKHGNLPFINPDMETVYDEKLAKAVIYTIMTGNLRYRTYSRTKNESAFSAVIDGLDQPIRIDGRVIKEDNLADLFGWLRQYDKLVDERAAAYDRDVSEAVEKLPQLVGMDTQELTRSITQDRAIIFPLRNNLFTKIQGAEDVRALQLGLLEFAYRVKLGEEANRDLDDAEKLLSVGYKTLCKFCFRRLRDDDHEARCNIYTQQLHKFLGEFIYDDTTQALRDPHGYASEVIQWANSQGYFKTMDIDGTYHNVTYSELLKTDEVKRAEEDYRKRTGKTTPVTPAETPATPVETPVTPTETPEG